jgi:dihydroflavonol-4-reductase
LPFYIPQSIFSKVEWIQGDILDVMSLDEAMSGTDAVIHSAAKVSFDHADRAEMFRTNIDGTANVINTALDKGVSRVLHVSSVAALGRTKNGDTVTEEKKWEESSMNTNYALSKYHGEMEVWRGMGEGLNVTVVNPSTILGYGDWNSSSCALFKNVYKEFPWYSTGVNGFVAVEDVARAVVLLLKTDTGGERFILNGENWTFQQLFNQIATGFNKKQPTREATPFLAEIAWRLEKLKSVFTGKASLLTRESARISQTKTYFNNDKIKSVLPGFDFTPLQVSIENACKSYLQTLQVPG